MNALAKGEYLILVEVYWNSSNKNYKWFTINNYSDIEVYFK